MSSSDDEELFEVSEDEQEMVNEQRAIENSFEITQTDSLQLALKESLDESVQKVKENVIDRINAIFGDDIDNLNKVNNLHQELLDKLDDLDNKLNVANTETPSQLHNSLRKGGCDFSCILKLGVDFCLFDVHHNYCRNCLNCSAIKTKKLMIKVLF